MYTLSSFLSLGSINRGSRLKRRLTACWIYLGNLCGSPVVMATRLTVTGLIKQGLKLQARARRQLHVKVTGLDVLNSSPGVHIVSQKSLPLLGAYHTLVKSFSQEELHAVQFNPTSDGYTMDVMAVYISLGVFGNPPPKKNIFVNEIKLNSQTFCGPKETEHASLYNIAIVWSLIANTTRHVDFTVHHAYIEHTGLWFLSTVWMYTSYCLTH